MIKRIAGAGLLLLGGLIFALVVAELGLRIAGISYPVFDAYDATRGVALKPGKEGWYRREGEAYLRINSLGYRDVEHELAKPPNTFRVAVIGDSYTEARQVAPEDTYWSRLQQGLTRCPALKGQRVEVLNFGIGGYATTEELLTFRQDASRFAPSLVLLAFYAANDVHDNSRELSRGADWRMNKPIYVYENGALVLDNSFRTSTSRRLLYESVHHFRLMELLNQARRVWTVRQMQRAASQTQGQVELGVYHQIYRPPADDNWREAWTVTEGLLAQFNDEVRATGAEFVVTTVTMGEQVNPDPGKVAGLAKRLGVNDLLYPDRRLVEIGVKHDFPVIQLSEPLRELATRDQVYFHGFRNTIMGEGHWNERGHEAAADVLTREICDRVLAPASRVSVP